MQKRENIDTFRMSRGDRRIHAFGGYPGRIVFNEEDTLSTSILQLDIDQVRTRASEPTALSFDSTCPWSLGRVTLSPDNVRCVGTHGGVFHKKVLDPAEPAIAVPSVSPGSHAVFNDSSVILLHRNVTVRNAITFDLQHSGPMLSDDGGQALWAMAVAQPILGSRTVAFMARQHNSTPNEVFIFDPAQNSARHVLTTRRAMMMGMHYSERHRCLVAGYADGRLVRYDIPANP